MSRILQWGQRIQAHLPLAAFTVCSVVLLATVTATTIYKSVSADTTETSFTIAQVPDTQNEVLSDGNPLLPGRYQWLSDNQQPLNLKFIAQIGDNVNWGVVDPVQFTRVDNAVKILDASTVPYSLAIGNHDGAAVTVGGSAAPGNVHDNLRNTTVFNQTFPLTRFKNVQGNFEPNKVDNMWQTFAAGGDNWMLITHEMWPRESVIQWMEQLVASHPNYNVIISTHAFIDQQNDLPTSGNYGDQNALIEWDEFISQYSNIKMVLSGHYGPTATNPGIGYREFTGVHGNKVTAIMTAYHATNQNQVRLLNINSANNTISSSVYVSQSLNNYPTGYITDAYSNFVTTNMSWVRPDGSTTPDPTIVAPSAPQAVTATAGNGSAMVSFTPPTSNGGSGITGYTVTSSPGGLTASGSSSPITISGLTNGTAYTFSVTATNIAGTGASSAASSAVTPIAPPVTELLTDPSFESGLGGWSAFGYGVPVTVTTPVHGGTKAVSVASNTTTVGLAGMSNINVAKNTVTGKQYNAQCWVRPTVANTTIIIRLLQYDQLIKVLNATSGITTATALPVNTWTLLKVSGLATLDNYRMIPQVYATAQTSSTGSVIYDDCSVTAAMPVTTPGAPSSVSAVAGNGSAAISFTPPASNGGALITGYTVTSSPGGLTASGTGSPIAVTGLTNGTAYSFTVTATNTVGTSPASSPSASVTPSAPITVPEAPFNLLATGIDGQALLSWDAPASDGGAAISDYMVFYRELGSTIWLQYNDGLSTLQSATIPDLTNGTTYEFFVRASNSVGVSPDSNSFAATPVAPEAPPATAPAAPQTVTAIAGDGSAVVSFTPPTSDGGAAITGYTVTSTPEATSANGYGSPISVTGLTNGTAYSFTVTATNTVGTSPVSDASASVIPTTPAIAPDAPTSLTAVAGDKQAILTWAAPANDGGAAISDYGVYYRELGSALWLPDVDDVSPALSATVSGLSNQTTYEFAITAHNSAGDSQFSETAQATPFVNATVPSAPGDVIAVASDGSATIAYDLPASDGGTPITGYTVTSTPGGLTASGTSTPITITGLTNGVSYSFVISAQNAVGSSPDSAPSNSVTPQPPASVPSEPTAVAAIAGNSTASISFTPSASDGGSAISDYTVTSSPGGLTTTGATSPLTVTGLTNGTAYTFSVTARNVVGNSTASSPSNSVTPQAPVTAPTAPTNLVGTAGNGQVSLSWIAPSSNGGAAISDYTVQYRPTGSTIWVTYNDGVSTATATTVSSLTNTTAYDFSVTASNSVGSSAGVSISGVTPTAPELLADPGFESGLSGWSGFGFGVPTTVTTPVHGGTKAVSVSSNSTTVGLSGMSNINLIKNSVVGKQYSAQCWVRPTVANTTVMIRFLQYDQLIKVNTNIGTTTATALPLNTWTLVRVTGTATIAGYRIIPQVYATVQTSSTGSVIYDDCSVTSN